MHFSVDRNSKSSIFNVQIRFNPFKLTVVMKSFRQKDIEKIFEQVMFNHSTPKSYPSNIS